MKKLNYITILSLSAGLAFAWNATADEERFGIHDQNSNYWNKELQQNSNPAWVNHEKSLFEALTDNTALSLAVVRNNTYIDQGFTFGKDGFEFGTYTYDLDANNNVVNLKYSKVGAVGYQKISEEAGISDAFNTGDMVGIYIQDIATGDYLYSNLYSYNNKINATISHPDTHSESVSTEYNGKARTWEGELADPAGYFSVFFDTYYLNNPKVEHPEGQYNDPVNQAIRIQVVSAAPAGGDEPVTPASGGPLPGVWATIALAGAASAYLKRRRKENK